MGACFWLPEARKVHLERWMRGRSELRELERADVVVAAFGKSGRTWLRVMLEEVERRLGAEGSAARALRPRVFFTHDNYIQDYTGDNDSKAYLAGHRVVLLVRDPRDVTVSQYFQWKHRMKRGKTRVNGFPPKGADVSLFDFVVDPVYGLVRCVAFLNLWAKEVDRPKELLVVRYEDLRAEPVHWLGQIASFIGLEASEQDIAEAVEGASIENMRRREAANTSPLAGGRLKPGDRDNADSYKVRRAKVGGWRDYFSDDEVERIDTYVETHLLPDFGYTGSGSRSEAAERG